MICGNLFSQKENTTMKHNKWVERTKHRSCLMEMATHDLKNYVLAMYLKIQKALREHQDPSHQTLLGELFALAKTMNWFLDNITDIRAMQKGELKADIKKLDVGFILNQVRVVAEPMATLNGVSLAVEQSCTGSVLCDAYMLERILINLVNNAIKFSHAGGMVSIACYEESPEFVVFQVKDQGKGMTKEEKEHAFDLYWHKGSSGSGLGLCIVKELVSYHGGRVWVKSEAGVGTTISFTIPGVVIP